MSKAFSYTTAVSNIRYVEFHLVSTSRVGFSLDFTSTRATQSWKRLYRAGDDRTYVMAFRILVTESNCSYNPSQTTRLIICAQQRRFKYLKSSIAFGPANILFKYLIAPSFEDALSTMTVNTASIPQLFIINQTPNGLALMILYRT